MDESNGRGEEVYTYYTNAASSVDDHVIKQLRNKNGLVGESHQSVHLLYWVLFARRLINGVQSLVDRERLSNIIIPRLGAS